MALQLHGVLDKEISLSRSTTLGQSDAPWRSNDDGLDPRKFKAVKGPEMLSISHVALICEMK